MLISILTKDNSYNPINFSFIPKRIVSLVPSQTELLFNLGLSEEVIGITRFCIYPPAWFRTKQCIGGTKTVKMDVVKALQPDLIIANKEENLKEQVEEMEKIAPVWVSDIKTLDDALEMIISVGKLVNRETRANELVSGIKEAFRQIKPLSEKLNTAYLIWKDPYMAAGADTFIHDMLTYCGFVNIFKDINRYPEVSINEFSLNNAQKSIINLPSSVNSHLFNSHLSTTKYLSNENCQLLLLSSEPYPFKQKHLDELQTLLPFAKIMLVDGEMFSWYGSRLLYSPGYFKDLIQQIRV